MPPNGSRVAPSPSCWATTSSARRAPCVSFCAPMSGGRGGAPHSPWKDHLRVWCLSRRRLFAPSPVWSATPVWPTSSFCARPRWRGRRRCRPCLGSWADRGPWRASSAACSTSMAPRPPSSSPGRGAQARPCIARTLHDRSLRREGPFVVMSCRSLPEETLESELFGHVAGAVASSPRERIGRVQAASGGTLFLEEVNRLPAALQYRLLTLLLERSFQRKGSNEKQPSNARIMASSEVDLHEAVERGEFREDLYYRLNVVPMEIPPLRERRDDIEPLATFLLARAGARQGRALRFSPDALRTLLDHQWPGNVRELESVLEYAVAVCKGQTMLPEDLPVEIRNEPFPGRPASPLPTDSPFGGDSPTGAPLPANDPSFGAQQSRRDGARPGARSQPLETERSSPRPRDQPNDALAPHARGGARLTIAARAGFAPESSRATRSGARRWDRGERLGGPESSRRPLRSGPRRGTTRG